VLLCKQIKCLVYQSQQNRSQFTKNLNDIHLSESSGSFSQQQNGKSHSNGLSHPWMKWKYANNQFSEQNIQLYKYANSKHKLKDLQVHTKTIINLAIY